jgi:cytochrome c biogenesis protein CcmG/thiol:disulfide interchange protein DsbE
VDESERPRRSPLKIAAQAIALAAVFGLLGVLVWRVTHHTPSVSAALARGTKPEAPFFDLPRLTGRGRIDLAAYRGHPVVLDFWASWCYACPHESKRLQAAMRRYGKFGVVALGVNSKDLSSDAKRYLRKYRIRYPSVRDGDGKVLNRWVGGVRMPTLFFVSRSGKVVGEMEAEEDLPRYLKEISRRS